MGRGGSGCAEAGGRVGYMHSKLTDGQGWLAGQHTATAHPVRHYQTYLPTRSQILPSSPPTCGVKNEILGSGGGPRRQQAGVAAVIGHRLQAGRQSRATIPLISGGEGFTSTTAEHQAGDHSAHNSRAGQ